jgi:hypothetical protein
MALNYSHSCIRSPVPYLPYPKSGPYLRQARRVKSAGHASWTVACSRRCSTLRSVTQAPSEGQSIAVAPDAVPVMVAPAGAASGAAPMIAWDAGCVPPRR